MTLSMARGLWGWARARLDCFAIAPLRPGFSMSRILASWSMSPALRSALAAMALLPGAGVGLEKVGCDMDARDGGAFDSSELCGCGRLRSGVDGMASVLSSGTTPQVGASSWQ
ncbi:hypothetical protein C8Q79DRAFT_504588 [Trametes meyenii]|nr:hypothetical protein C8Q79DRAFT_504588 [Trametes meyenii]